MSTMCCNVTKFSSLKREKDVFLEGQIRHLSRGMGHSTPTPYNFEPSYMRPHSMTNSNQIVHGHLTSPANLMSLTPSATVTRSQWF